MRADRTDRVLKAVGKRIGEQGDMPIRVSVRTIAVIFRRLGLRGWELGQDEFREIDALALDALLHLASVRP